MAIACPGKLPVPAIAPWRGHRRANVRSPRRIRDQLPTIFHTEDLPPGDVQRNVHDAVAAYRVTLPSAYQSLLDRYELRDAAIKVVGVGSVGTLCMVLLMMARQGDPLFLQVIKGWLRRVIARDIFLGWSRGPRRDFFVRQLRDMKLSIRVEILSASEMAIYAGWCGRALALSHARAGSAALLSGYMGRSDAFDKALTAFSFAYADQNEADHRALERAVKQGTVPAVFEEGS